MQSPFARFFVSFFIAAAVAVLLGGFVALVGGAVAGAMLPGTTKEALVSPYVCPSGTKADIESRDTQCSSTNRNSGTCQQIKIRCLDDQGNVAKELDANTSLLWDLGFVLGYIYVAIGGFLFLVVFFPMFFLLRRSAKRKATASPAQPSR